MTDKANNAPSQENPHIEDEFDAEMPQDDAGAQAEKDATASAPAEDLPRERIAKRIARSGVCSRRDAEQLILDGKVKLNGKRLDTPAVTVTDNDIIYVNDAPLPEKQKPRLWRLFKKRGLVTSHRDEQGRETVFDNLPPHMPRVISVGRLDLNSEGLLLLTNDGELARYLELPSTGWARRYRVRVHGFIDDAKLKQLEDGITIDGVNYGSIQAEVDVQKGTNAWMTVTLREGKNREIRRVMEHLGWPVTRLMRLSYGPFHLGKMAPGEIDEITGKVMKEQLAGFFNGEGGKADPDRDGRATKPRPKKAAPARKPADRNKERFDRNRSDDDTGGFGGSTQHRSGGARPFNRDRQEQNTGSGTGARRGFGNRDDARDRNRDNDFRSGRNDRPNRGDRDNRADRGDRTERNQNPNRGFRNDHTTGGERSEGSYRGRNSQSSGGPRGQGRPDNRAGHDDRNERNDRGDRNDSFRGRRDRRDNRDGNDTSRSFGGNRNRNNDADRNDAFRSQQQTGGFAGRGGRSGRRDQQNRGDDFNDAKRGSGPEARSDRPAGRGKPDARRDRDEGDNTRRDTTNRPTNKGRGRYAGGNTQNNRQNDRPAGPRGSSRPGGGNNGRRGGDR
ncbi:pseudouridine synthase [Thalassospira profundimaris]|uniref:pseudouridine synthase n=1 Tax=Thalassospira profundimaris TaxID=502049 RepID=UPI000DED5D14|nr:pseudouridine synthase [Thalassospira profundimaris]